MEHITGILMEEGINILGSVTNGGAEFGTVRMVVSKPEEAKEAVQKAGYLCRLVEVLGIQVEDEVGNMHHLLKAFSDSNINLDYTYLSFHRDTGKPVIIVHTDDIYEVENCMRAKGFTTVDGIVLK